MTERQSRFVDEYLMSGNATQAAKNAGYSAKSARQIGSENLTKPSVSEAVRGRLDELKEKNIAKTEEVLEHLTAVMRGEIKETIVTPSGKKFVVPVKEADRLTAAEKLLRVYGAYRDKLEVKTSGAELLIRTLEKIDAEENA